LSDGAATREIVYLWRTYALARLRDRLFVLVRRLVCPWEKVVEVLPSTGRILDVGCGRGLLAALIRRDRPALGYVGIDVNQNVIEIAESVLTDASTEFRPFDPESPPSIGRFDCVVLVDVLCLVELERWPLILSFCKSQLKEGGRLVLKETVSTPRWKVMLTTFQETLATQVLRYTQGERPHFEAEEVYLDLLRRLDFEVVSRERVDALRPWPHHLIVAELQRTPALKQA
jgi:2-polyprenyl-3-methyl-5-hydroxy-6-metoxy-1,4-benzoquinol methylase